MWKFRCNNKRCWFNEVFEDNLVPRACPKCNGRNYQLSIGKELTKEIPFVNIGYKDNPRWSWSMGVNVQDIPVMMKKYSDRTYNPKTGQLLVKNRPNKKRLMREHGLEELS